MLYRPDRSTRFVPLLLFALRFFLLDRFRAVEA